MVTQQVASTLFINSPSNLIIIGADVKGKHKGAVGLFRLFKEIRSNYGIDAFADLHDVIRTHFLTLYCRLYGIPVARIRKGRAMKRKLTRSRRKQLTQLITSHERYFDVFHRLGFDSHTDFASLYKDKADPSEFSEITPPKADGEKWIAIAPFAKHKGKIYPVEKMEEVVSGLSELQDVKIFLFGGGGYERDVLRKWADKFKNTISIAEKRYGFQKELALLSHADVMLSMDSANMHLASLVNVPVISIWGATHPYCGFTGWKQNAGNIIQADMPCRPCSVFGNKECARGDYACLYGIAPETILKKVKKILYKGNDNE